MCQSAKCYTAFIVPGGCSFKFCPDPWVKPWTSWQQRRALQKMALAHKGVRFPATPYLKLHHGFSWISFHIQNQRVRKRLLCEDPTKRGQWDFNPQQIWPLLLLKTEIQCPKGWFGVRDFVCPGGVHSRTRSWGSLTLWDHPVQNFSSARSSFLTGKGAGLYWQQLFKKSQISPLYMKTLKPCVGKKTQLEICDRSALKERQLHCTAT